MIRRLAPGLLVLGAVIAGATGAGAQDKRPGEVVARSFVDASAGRPTIVLVDGAIGDANSWQSVIPILQKPAAILCQANGCGDLRSKTKPHGLQGAAKDYCPVHRRGGSRYQEIILDNTSAMLKFQQR